MDKKEKELRLAEHIGYWKLVEKLRDVSLGAIDEVLSVDDVISALDRIKIEFIQQQIIVKIEQDFEQNEEEELEIEGERILPQRIDTSFVQSSEMIEEVKRGMLNN